MALRVLLTGAGSSAAQNVLQSLKEAPEEVFVVGVDVDPARLELGPLDATHVVSESANADFIGDLDELACDYDIDLVVPQADRDVQAIAAARSQGMSTNTFLPPTSVLNLCYDKLESARRWYQLGLRSDAVHSLERPEDAERAVRDLGLPMWVRARWGAGNRAAVRADALEEVERWASYWVCRGVAMVAHEYLPGEDYCCHSVWFEGEEVMGALRRRVPTFADTTFDSNIHEAVEEQTVQDVARATVRASAGGRPHGIFCVDMKTAADGRVVPTEVNAGRFNTPSLFFARLGLNMPYCAVHLGVRGTPPPGVSRDAEPVDGMLWIRDLDAGPAMVHRSRLRAWARRKQGRRGEIVGEGTAKGAGGRGDE